MNTSMSADDASWWIQGMGGKSVNERTIALGQPYAGQYPISYSHTARSGGMWFLFGHKVQGQLTQNDCANILSHIGQ